MFTSLTDTNFGIRLNKANDIAVKAKFVNKVTPELVQDALKFIEGMSDGPACLRAAKAVAIILPVQPQTTIFVGGVEFTLPTFFDWALAKDSPFFKKKLEPTFKDARTFPELDLDVFKCFLARAYEGDKTPLEFEGCVECIRMVYEYEFTGYASAFLLDFICRFKTFTLQQIATCYSLAYEIDEGLLIDTLDCMQNTSAPHALSLSCTVSHLSQLTRLLERNPNIEFIEIILDATSNIGNIQLIKVLDQFKSLTHVLIIDTQTVRYTYNPYKECRYKVSYFADPVLIRYMTINTIDNFEMGFIPKIKIKNITKFLRLNANKRVNLTSFVDTLNQYLLLILRGAFYYNLNVIPNKLPFDEDIQQFLTTHFSAFIDVSWEFIGIKEGFNLDDFLKKVHNLTG